MPELSLVVPVRNECENVRPLIQEIRAALDGKFEYEVIYVDDGSTDDTVVRLNEIKRDFSRLRVMRHRVGCGQSTAIATGYFYSIFSFFLPWSLFIVPLGFWLYSTRPQSAAARFALVWFLLTFALLSLNPSKQMQYALLLAPSLMVLIGCYLAQSAGAYARFNNVILAIVSAVAFTVLVVHAVKWRAFGSLDALPVIVLIVCGSLPWLLGRTMRLSLPNGLLLLAGLATGGYVHAQRYIHEQVSARAAVRDFAAKTRDYSPLFAYAEGNPRLSFYMQRVIPAVKDELALRRLLEKPIYVIVDGGAPQWRLPASLVVKHGRLELWKISPQGVTTGD